MLCAKVVSIQSHFPSHALSNDVLGALYPDWPSKKIFEKTGIEERRIAANEETAADLAFEAAYKLIINEKIDPYSVDYLLFCTQTPDYILPTTACILQDRLGLGTHCGALDFNLGCSGFVYGLSLAKGLIETGQATRVLLLTADTYSKFINPMDRSVRTLFGDAATATLIDATEADAPYIGPFVFGTDGRGAPNLIVPTGASRRPRDAESAIETTDAWGNIRAPDNLYMNGPEIMTFTLKSVPKAVADLLAKAGMIMDDFDTFIFHQANAFMLERLRRKLAIPVEKFVLHMRDCGNTVSSTIPLALESIVRDKQRQTVMLVGFGVGYSWAATRMVI